MLHDAPEIKSRDVPANFKEKNKVSGPNRKKSEQFGKKKLGDKKKKYKNNGKIITVSSCARKMRTFELFGALFNQFFSKLVFPLPFGGQQP